MISIYTLTSALHDEKAVDRVTAEFLNGLGLEYTLRGSDFSTYGKDDLSLIYVRTGGTENLFKAMYEQVTAGHQPVFLLTSGKSNSLAASMEILSYLRKCGSAGEILHGSSEYIRTRIEKLLKVETARRTLNGRRLGVIGRPSDWLISSVCDYEAVKEKIGVEIVDIPMDELVAEIKAVHDATGAGQVIPLVGMSKKIGECEGYEKVKSALPGAEAIYLALKGLVRRYGLSGLTIRCFDLLSSVGNTGCLALARLNSEGIVSSCEGDIPALLSMLIARALTGKTGFQANPSRIDPETGRMVFAHCTVPFDMLDDCAFDTHFESGIGVGIRGNIIPGPVTVFKVSGGLDRFYAADAGIECNLNERDLCRTQIVVKVPATDYFLNNPIGNHHIIVPGHCADLLASFLNSFA